MALAAIMMVMLTQAAIVNSGGTVNRKTETMALSQLCGREEHTQKGETHQP